MRQPVFEVHTPTAELLIFAEGEVEYKFRKADLPPGSQIIINRIPWLLAAAYAEGASSADKRE